jgi:Leucine-rich repeat (LRR) protein
MASYNYTAHSWYSYPKVIPSNVETLSITFVGIDKVPENLKNATNIKELILTGNSITVLEGLPPNLEILTCNMNKIKEIKNLPATLTHMYCNYNQLTVLDGLPPYLEDLDCADNKIERIERLPKSLIRLECSYNKLKSLPALPPKLKILYTQYNYLVCLPTLPEGLKEIYYHNNKNISELDYLPHSITNLHNDSIPQNKYVFGYIESLRSRLEKERNINRTKALKEDLMAAAWHPDRVEKWLAVGYEMD